MSVEPRLTDTIEASARGRALDSAWVIGPGASARALAALCRPGRLSKSLDADSILDSRSLVFVPEFPTPRPSRTWTAESLDRDVAAPLLALITDLQVAIRLMLEEGSGGRVVLVVPAEHALGRSGSAAAGAMAGGVISMARTLAIELKRKSIAVNVLFSDFGDEPPPGVEAQLDLLLDEESWITGQEIWIGANSELGRRRP